MSNRRVLLLPAVFAAVLAPRIAGAQSGNASDVTGTSTTAVVGGLYAPGTVSVPVTPAVAAAVVSAGTTSASSATAGTLSSPITGTTISPAVGQTVVGMMTNATPEIRAQVSTALLTSGASPAAVAEAMSFLPSLLSNPSPGQVAGAITSFNAIAQTATAAFLANPTPEFVAIHTILSQMSSAARAAQ